MSVTLANRLQLQSDIAESEGWLTEDALMAKLEIESDQHAEFISGYIHSGGNQFDAETEWNMRQQ